MTYTDNTSVHSRTLTAMFDTQAAADSATRDLVAAGIPREQIKLSGSTEAGATTTATSTATQDKSFWEELKDMFLPEEDRHSYAEGLRRGGYLLSVRVDEANYNRVVDILDRDGSVNMDEREASWKSEGWTGYQGGSAGPVGSTTTSSFSAAGAGPAAAGLGTAATGVGTGAVGAGPATGAVSTGTGTKVDALQTGADEVIPIYEETASVAKRDVNHGRVRLRSYVVETPISEQVNLRNETVQVDRRPVDRPVSGTDALFQDRVIEAEEHVEEAFITKQARVKEEISIHKTVENQAQTVSDTVRHTEVEIDDQRGARGVAGAQRFSAATDSGRIQEHMDVIASDGTKVGTVDHLDGVDKIKLAKSTSPDGEHHYVPLSWVDHVDQHVHLTKSATDVRAGW